MLKLKIKKGDKVQVITGGDKGKKGTVIEVNTKALKIKIEGVKIQTHYDKKDGLLKKEGFIDYSNVQLIEKSAKATKEKKTAKKSAAKSKQLVDQFDLHLSLGKFFLLTSRDSVEFQTYETLKDSKN